MRGTRGRIDSGRPLSTPSLWAAVIRYHHERRRLLIEAAVFLREAVDNGSDRHPRPRWRPLSPWRLIVHRSSARTRTKGRGAATTSHVAKRSPPVIVVIVALVVHRAASRPCVQYVICKSVVCSVGSNKHQKGRSCKDVVLYLYVGTRTVLEDGKLIISLQVLYVQASTECKVLTRYAGRVFFTRLAARTCKQ